MLNYCCKILFCDIGMNYIKLKSNISSVAADKHTTFDVGLRAYMLSVYNYMMLALAVTGAVAIYIASSPQLVVALMSSAIWWVAVFAPIGIVMFMSIKSATISFQAARACLFVYAASLGVSVAIICYSYTGESIARVFFITASLFGAMSIYGYTTKRDLTNFGSFLMMGLFGVIIASLVNIFLRSSGLHYITSFICVLIFTGLTAYDVRKIKDSYYALGGASADVSKVAVFGALNLYMDFINLFISLLRIMGNRRD